MKLLPQTAFGQTMALAMGTAVFTAVSAMVMITQFAGPQRAETIAALTGVALSGLEAVPPGDSRALIGFAQARGIRWTDDDLPGRAAPAFGRFSHRLNTALSERFGAPVEFRFLARSAPNFWIRLGDWPDIWLAPPGASRINVLRWSILGWMLGSAVFAGLLSMLFAARLNRPLRRLQVATQALTRDGIAFDLEPAGPREVQTLTRAFADAVRRLRQAETDQELFLAGMSHDMRTPLARLRVSFEMLGEQDLELTRGMIHDVDELDSITAQFLGYVRDGSVEQAKPVDVAAVLNELAADLAREGQSVELSAQPVGTLLLEPLGVRRLLSNLLQNALRHGAPPVRASVRPTADDAGVEITVSDAGSGMNDHQWAVLSGRSTSLLQADGGRIGFGLHIMRRVIQRHGARIDGMIDGGRHQIRIVFQRDRVPA